MRVIEISSFGAPDVLRLGERPDPAPAAGEVLIRVAASGVNRPDVLQRTGNYPVPPGASDIPGLEVAGEIIAGDAPAMAAAGFKVGDRVCALVAGGGYAELCVAPVGQCLPVPGGLSDVQAASLPETFFTVWSNVFERAYLKKGEILLIQGGSSGIGVTAIQIAKALGATVLVTAGSDEKCAACVALGADHAINHKSSDFVEEVKKLTNGKGVNVILDMVAGSYIVREVELVNARSADTFVFYFSYTNGIVTDFDNDRHSIRLADSLQNKFTATNGCQGLHQKPFAFEVRLFVTKYKTALLQ